MKVLHVIKIDGVGGAEKLMVSLLPALHKLVRVECVIVYRFPANDAAFDLAAQLEAGGIRIHRLPFRKMLDLKMLNQLARLVKESKATVVHSHLKAADFWMALLKAFGKVKLPVVSTMHGYHDDYANRHGFKVVPGLKRSAYYWLSKWTFSRLDKFIVISKVLQQFLMESKLVAGQKSEIIYHGYAGEILDAPIRNRASGEPFRLVVPGRLVLLKGHRYAIEAVDMLGQQYPNLEMHFFGEGPERPVLEHLVKTLGLSDRIVFHGYVSNLHEWLQKMDIALIPSLAEAFGLVSLEAFAVGLPVIAFDLPALNEIIEHEETGLLVRQVESKGVADAIERLMLDDELRTKVINRSRNALRERFSMTVMAQKYIDVYSGQAGN